MIEETPLDTFLREMYPELKYGGPATLDQLFDLAMAIKDTLNPPHEE